MGHIAEFTATGRPGAISKAIEDYAKRRGAVSVLMVPWESDEVTLSMAITLVKTDGWAIEHTNLGTVRLTDLGQDRTQIAVLGVETNHPERERLSALLDGFGRELQARFGVAAGSAGRS